MRVEIVNRPDYAMARVALSPGEQIVAESGAMVARSAAVEIQTSMGQGGLLAAAKRSLLGGESFFVNTFTAREAGEVILAPGCPGDVMHVPLNGAMILQKESYLAASPGITTDTKFQGVVRGLLGGEGFFLLHCSGQGDLLVSSYGAIEQIDVAGEYIVDTGHIVAFDSTLDYKVEKLGNWRSTIFSGEFLVCRFSGTGRLFVQSRAVRPFAHWVHPFRRVKPKSNN